MWSNSEGGTVIVWEFVFMNITVVTLHLVCYDPHLHITSLDRHFNILILVNLYCMQWRILISWSGVAEGYTVWHYTILLNPTSKSGVATVSMNLKSSVRHVCLR
jgi:hypothetical protein